jgi:CubicO group peptidase (beta-lactamase class C family)
MNLLIRPAIKMFLLCCLLANAVGAQGNEQTAPLDVRADVMVVSGELGAQLDGYFTRLAAYGFSGTVLVAKGETVLLHKGYGFADVQRGIPNSTQTVYDVASLAKQFTAAAILKLEMQGKLKTTDALSKHFANVPADKRAITLHRLLTHTAGLKFECAGAAPLSRAQFVKCMLETPLDAEPGRQYFYSNGGYGLLAALIEQLTGQHYETFLQEQLFKPAGLTATGFTGDTQKWAAGIAARGYDEGIERGAPQTKPLTWLTRGAAGVVTSVGDLYRWELALRRQQILSAAATQKLFTAHVPTDARGGKYGYGWGIKQMTRGGHLISHDGVTFDGFNALFLRYVDQGLVAIAASNSFAGRYLPMELVGPALNAFLVGNGAAAPPPFVALEAGALEKYRGRYRLPSGAQLIVTVEQDKLIVGAEGQEAVELLAAVDRASSKLLTACNERSAALLNGVRAGNYETAIHAFAKQMSAGEAQRTIKNWLGGLEQKHGQLKSFELLGTAPEPGIARSFVRLRFERGVEVRRLRWEGDQLGNIVFARLPILSTVFRPQSATSFAGFHLGIARALYLNFNSNAARVVEGLTFQRVDGSQVKAERLPDVPTSEARKDPGAKQ